MPDTCKSITILSANGVGNSIQTSNLGIKLMEQWYLKDVYRAKNEIETLLKNYEDNDIKNLYIDQMHYLMGIHLQIQPPEMIWHKIY